MRRAQNPVAGPDCGCPPLHTKGGKGGPARGRALDQRAWLGGFSGPPPRFGNNPPGGGPDFWIRRPAGLSGP
jgi:hypothetical protein